MNKFFLNLEKSLDSLPPQVLHFRLRLMKFQYTIAHLAEKELYIPDTLSRAPLPSQLEFRIDIIRRH